VANTFEHNEFDHEEDISYPLYDHFYNANNKNDLDNPRENNVD